MPWHEWTGHDVLLERIQRRRLIIEDGDISVSSGITLHLAAAVSFIVVESSQRRHRRNWLDASLGFAVGTSRGGLWLQNDVGGIIYLHAKRTGLMLSLGGSAIVVSMNQ